MTILSQANLALLRTRPHATKLWLSAFQPTTVLACRVNDASIAKGARSITFDTVSSGSYLNIEADFTMLVGTSAGASDVGRIRVRSATSSVITVAENSDIAWADDLYLTVLKYVDVVPIFPRIIQDPSNPTNVIFYKDYDVAYTNQNTTLGSLICMTNHKAGLRDPASGIYQAYWTATGTYNVKSETLQYVWEFEGGSPSSYVGLEPGYVNYSTPGHYQTKLTVTGSSANDVGYRYVSVYDRPEAGTSTPILRWQLQELSTSRQGSPTMKVRVYDDVSTIQANTLIVLFADEYYGSTQISFGGNAKNNGTIKFVGYVVDGSITYNWKQSYVEFEVESVAGIMARKQGFSVSCESKNNPNTWFEIKDMSVTRAIYHYLRWHSTVLKVADFQYTGSDLKVQYFDADRESLYEAIANFLRNGLDAELVADMQGKLWAEISAGATPSSETAFPVTLAMDKQDWMGEPNIDERLINDISFVERGGIAYSGSVTGTFTALMSGAPGSAPAYAGTPDRKQGLILTGQTALNQLTGNLFAYKNSKYPDIEFVMSGNYSNLDVAPIERVQVNIAQADTNKGITLQNKPFHPVRIEWQYDPHNQTLTTTMSVAQLVNGVAGTTIRIPPTPPNQGFSVPSIQIPEIPALTFPGFGFGSGLSAYLALSSTSFSSNTIDWTTQLRAYGIGITHSGVNITLTFGGLYLITLQAQISTSATDKYVVIATGGDATDPVTFLNTKGAGDSTVNIHGAILDYYPAGHTFSCITDAAGDPLVSAFISVARLFTA